MSKVIITIGSYGVLIAGVLELISWYWLLILILALPFIRISFVLFGLVLYVIANPGLTSVVIAIVLYCLVNLVHHLITPYVRSDRVIMLSNLTG